MDCKVSSQKQSSSVQTSNLIIVIVFVSVVPFPAVYHRGIIVFARLDYIKSNGQKVLSTISAFINPRIRPKMRAGRRKSLFPALPLSFSARRNCQQIVLLATPLPSKFRRLWPPDFCTLVRELTALHGLPLPVLHTKSLWFLGCAGDSAALFLDFHSF